MKIHSLLLCLLYSFQTETSFRLIEEYNSRAKEIVTDQFVNFYSIENKRIEKLDKNGKFLCRYEEMKMGNISTVDVTNPMKITVYYPDYLIAVTLDRFLSPLTTYRFLDLGFYNVSAVASASDGRLWFYDLNDFKLKKIDESGNVYRQSQQLNLILEESINPQFILEKNNYVFVADSAQGIYQFDIFGGYIQKIPLKRISKFQYFQERFLYLKNDHMQSYEPKYLEEKAMQLPDSLSVISAVIEKERIATLQNGKLKIYQWE